MTDTPILHRSNAFRSVLEIIYYMATHGMNSREASEKAKLPMRYAEMYLQPLVREGILHSMRGPTGGVWLDADLDMTTLGDIFRTIEGERPRKEQSKGWTELREAIDSLFEKDIERRMMDELDRINLREFIRSTDLHVSRVQSSACQMREARL